MSRSAALLVALCFAAGALAQAPSQGGKPAAAPPAASKAEKKRKPATEPSWAELSAVQQHILAPLRQEWDTLEPDRKRTWLGIAKRYPKMTPEGQARVQKRMQTWAKLTPEQRQLARERYRALRKAPPEKRQALRKQWDEYMALTPEQRRNMTPPATTPAKPEKKTP